MYAKTGHGTCWRASKNNVLWMIFDSTYMIVGAAVRMSAKVVV